MPADGGTSLQCYACQGTFANAAYSEEYNEYGDRICPSCGSDFVEVLESRQTMAAALGTQQQQPGAQEDAGRADTAPRHSSNEAGPTGRPASSPTSDSYTAAVNRGNAQGHGPRMQVRATYSAQPMSFVDSLRFFSPTALPGGHQAFVLQMQDDGIMPAFHLGGPGAGAGGDILVGESFDEMVTRILNAYQPPRRAADPDAVKRLPRKRVPHHPQPSPSMASAGPSAATATTPVGVTASEAPLHLSPAAAAAAAALRRAEAAAAPVAAARAAEGTTPSDRPAAELSTAQHEEDSQPRAAVASGSSLKEDYCDATTAEQPMANPAATAHAASIAQQSTSTVGATGDEDACSRPERPPPLSVPSCAREHSCSASAAAECEWASASPGELCSVCHDTFEPGTEVVELPCHHCFHEDCITPWLVQRNTCPVCRTELPPATPSDAAPPSAHAPAPDAAAETSAMHGSRRRDHEGGDAAADGSRSGRRGASGANTAAPTSLADSLSSAPALRAAAASMFSSLESFAVPPLALAQPPASMMPMMEAMTVVVDMVHGPDGRVSITTRPPGGVGAGGTAPGTTAGGAGTAQARTRSRPAAGGSAAARAGGDATAGAAAASATPGGQRSDLPGPAHLAGTFNALANLGLSLGPMMMPHGVGSGLGALQHMQQQLQQQQQTANGGAPGVAAAGAWQGGSGNDNDGPGRRSVLRGGFFNTPQNLYAGSITSNANSSSSGGAGTGGAGATRGSALRAGFFNSSSGSRGGAPAAAAGVAGGGSSSRSRRSSGGSEGAAMAAAGAAAGQSSEGFPIGTTANGNGGQSAGGGDRARTSDEAAAHHFLREMARISGIMLQQVPADASGTPDFGRSRRPPVHVVRRGATAAAGEAPGDAVGPNSAPVAAEAAAAGETQQQGMPEQQQATGAERSMDDLEKLMSPSKQVPRRATNEDAATAANSRIASTTEAAGGCGATPAAQQQQQQEPTDSARGVPAGAGLGARRSGARAVVRPPVAVRAAKLHHAIGSGASSEQSAGASAPGTGRAVGAAAAGNGQEQQGQGQQQGGGPNPVAAVMGVATAPLRWVVGGARGVFRLGRRHSSGGGSNGGNNAPPPDA